MASSKEKSRLKKSTIKKRGPGRPAVKDIDRLMVIGTRVSPRVYKLLKKKADSEETGVSSLLREICESSVKKRMKVA